MTWRATSVTPQSDTALHVSDTHLNILTLVSRDKRHPMTRRAMSARPYQAALTAELSRALATEEALEAGPYELNSSCFVI